MLASGHTHTHTHGSLFVHINLQTETHTFPKEEHFFENDPQPEKNAFMLLLTVANYSVLDSKLGNSDDGVVRNVKTGL